MSPETPSHPQLFLLETIKERHRTDLARFERDLRLRDELEREKPPIHSSYVRDMQHTEERLAVNACFEEARLVRLTCGGLRVVE